MNIDTKQIEKTISDYCKSLDSYGSVPYEVDIDYNKNDKRADITLKREYDYVNFDFAFLEFLSQIFKTKKINVGDRNEYSRCDTYGHGSSYEIMFRIWDIGSTESGI